MKRILLFGLILILGIVTGIIFTLIDNYIQSFI